VPEGIATDILPPAAASQAAALAGLRVGIDGFNLAMPRGTGVATYGRILTEALGSLGCHVDVLYGLGITRKTPAMLREVLFFDGLDTESGRAPPTAMTPRWFEEAIGTRFGVRGLQIPITGRVVATGFASRLPHFDRVLNVPDLFRLAERYFKRTRRFLRVRLPDPPKIMHWTYPLPLLLEGAHNVFTLHDLVPLRLPYTTLDNKRAYLRLIRGCLRWGDHVCTVSEASRRDIMELFAAPPERITNTYQTASLPPPPVPLAELDTWLAGLFDLRRGGYFLFFGALEPKKNVGRIIEAYLAAGLETPLVIVGGRAWKSETELRLVQGKEGKRITGTEQVRMLEYMPGTWLSGLVQGARAVLFPSLYEGFGLPVLEAMQLGIPVLTSTESSLPEVAGDAAVLVDPYRTTDIAEALRIIDGDDDLRARMSDAGRQQAELFSLAAYQARLAAMYRTVQATRRGTPIVLPPRNREQMT
jgi:glycosyltransferase involved in cell wall biosynthesis